MYVTVIDPHNILIRYGTASNYMLHVYLSKAVFLCLEC